MKFDGLNILKDNDSFLFELDGIVYETTTPVDYITSKMIFESISDYINSGNTIIANDYNKDMFYCKIYFKAVDNNKYRIIIPDEKQLFPWDTNCNKIYKAQIATCPNS